MKANKTINLSTKTNLLEQDLYEYKLQDVSQPELFRRFSHITRFRRYPTTIAMYRWICRNTFTSLIPLFRDGQQSREPYTTQQMVDLYKMLHRLGGPNGIVRQTEFLFIQRRTVMR